MRDLVWRLKWRLAKRTMSDEFRNAYKDFISRVHVVDWESRQPFAGVGAQVRRVCDFGCANGLRVTQFLGQIFPAGVPPDLVVHGIEKDGDWGPDFLRTFSGSQAEFFVSARNVRAEEYDLVHLSSMLYDDSRARHIADLLRRCRDGTFVAVRGWLLRPVPSEDSFVEEDRSASAEPGWVTEYLRPLVARTSLKRVHEALGTEPDAIVRQRFRLADGGVESAVRFQRSVNQPRRAVFMGERFREMLRQDPAASVAHDDVMYLYRIQR